MSDLTELIERVEKASEGDFDLDKSILSMMGYSWRGMNYWRDDRTMWPNGASVRFTQSVDAAAALVERVLPGAKVMIHNWAGGDKPISVRIGRDAEDVRAPSMPLALILALLRALHQESSHAD